MRLFLNYFGMPGDVFDILLSAAGCVCTGCRTISRHHLNKVENLNSIARKAAEEAEIGCLKADNNVQLATNRCHCTCDRL